MTRFLGVDLAWREGRAGLPANETGVAVLDPAGRILDAGWTRGVPDTLAWAQAAAGRAAAVMFVDASLIVRNPAGQRLCETQVGQRYGAWKVSAHSTNLRSPRLDSHPVTRQLAAEPSPLDDAAYKHREDLIDALLCAWTAALWVRHGLQRCQVLGLPDGAAAGTAAAPAATIIVPARPGQRGTGVQPRGSFLPSRRLS